MDLLRFHKFTIVSHSQTSLLCSLLPLRCCPQEGACVLLCLKTILHAHYAGVQPFDHWPFGTSASCIASCPGKVLPVQGHAYTTDFGSPDIAEEFNYILPISPIHNVRQPTGEGNGSQEYPAMLITTGAPAPLRSSGTLALAAWGI